MTKQFFKYLCFCILFAGFSEATFAQKKKAAPKKRTSTKRTTKTKTQASVEPTTATIDSVVTVAAPANDSLPIKKIAKSLRRDAAVEDDVIRDRVPLAYEHLRADDAVYRHKIWREIDAREKINLPFRYAADENNGNQRFISILLQAIQDSSADNPNVVNPIVVFNSIDDRFTTPMSKAEVNKIISGEPVDVPQYDSLGNLTGTVKKMNEINLDSFYRFRVKEEVVFDKESSRLFFRVLGIAPVKDVITSLGVNLGPTELFWVYYPDMRAIFAKYEVFNGKNFGARMSWEELFESRMFYGRIIKSTIDNPYDQPIRNYRGLQDNGILQLLEGENIKEQIFNYEQNLWSY